MNRTWNRLYGIDPEIVIPDEDKRIVEEKYLAFTAAARPGFWLQLAPLIFLIAVSMLGLAVVETRHWPSWTIVFFLLGSVLSLLRWGPWIARRHFGPLFRRELRARGYDICDHCGYWLRGLGDDVKNCPECGTPRQDEPQ